MNDDIEKALNGGAGYDWNSLSNEDPSWWFVTYRTLCRCERVARLGPWREPPLSLAIDLDTTWQRHDRDSDEVETLGSPEHRVFVLTRSNPWDRTALYTEQIHP